MIALYYINIPLFIILLYLYKHLKIRVSNINYDKPTIKIWQLILFIINQFIPILNIVVNSLCLIAILMGANDNDCKLEGKLFNFLNKKI